MQMDVMSESEGVLNILSILKMTITDARVLPGIFCTRISKRMIKKMPYTPRLTWKIWYKPGSEVYNDELGPSSRQLSLIIIQLFVLNMIVRFYC